MKFKMMKGLLVVAMIPMMLALSACGKKDEGGAIAVVPTTSTTGYYQANGLCYIANSTTVVEAHLCATNPQVGGIHPGGTVGHYPVPAVPVGYYPGTGGQIGGYIGGQIGGHIGGGAGAYGGVCRGWFYHVGQGWGVCNGYSNCRQMVLYNSSGQPVYCP